MYNPASKKAEEFINHEEILATLNYAEENKHNEVLITELIEKAKLRKGSHTVRHLSYWRVTSKKKIKKSML